MTLEKEIKQKKPFNSIYEKTMVNLMYSHGWLIEQMRLFFNPFDITLKQYNILRILRGAEGPLTTSIIRDRMIDKMSDTTRLIDRMIKKNWVIKRICTEDRRLVDVEITDEGLAKLTEIEQNETKITEVLRYLSAEEAVVLSKLLDKMRHFEEAR